ncbi:MAG: hypothetical protein J1E31_06365, partial [Helicobacter sp.]|nr:hypothetical protein [Helicobacter sp.]
MELGKYMMKAVDSGLKDVDAVIYVIDAAKGMQKVLKSTRYIASGKASDFNAATPAAVVISGIW